MKRFSFVHMLVMLVVVITLASCGMTQPIYEDGYERPSARRVYSDPYYGGQTVLVRDPYTGQIYEAIPTSPYGYGYEYPNGGYYPNGRSYGRSSRGYSRGYSRNTAPVYRDRGSNNNNGSSNSSQGSKKIDRAKDIINGKN